MHFVQFRGLSKDCQLESLQFGRGVDTQCVDEGSPGPLKGLQRIALPAESIVRSHQPSPERLVSWSIDHQRLEPLRLVALSVPFQALPLWILPLHVGAPALVSAIFVSGVANGICNPTIHAMWTLRMPPAIRAKAMTASMTIWGLGMPLGLVVAGPVLSAYGARPVLVGFAAVQTVAMLGVAAASLRARAAVPEPVPA